MAFRISFFGNQKHKVFNYKPIFWNPEKEELQERIRASREKYSKEKADADDHAYVPGSSIRGAMRDPLQQKSNVPGNNKIVRAIIIISFAALLGMLFYFADTLSYFISVFGQ